jgi:hypothetical protein
MANLKKHKIEFYKWDKVQEWMCSELNMSVAEFNTPNEGDTYSLFRVWELLDSNAEMYETEFFETNIKRCVEELLNAEFYSDGIYEAAGAGCMRLVPVLNKLKDHVGPIVLIQY